MTTDLMGLSNQAVRLLRDYAKAEAESKTPITRALANVLVDGREHFQDAEGFTDWRGKTYPYRRWVRDIFDNAKIDREESGRVQAAIRYHVSSVLRDRLDSAELERLGMIPQTARERSQERRTERSALLNALDARDAHGGALMALTALAAILSRLDADEVAALVDEERAFAEAKLRDLNRRSGALLRRLK